MPETPVSQGIYLPVGNTTSDPGLNLFPCSTHVSGLRPACEKLSRGESYKHTLPHRPEYWRKTCTLQFSFRVSCKSKFSATSRNAGSTIACFV